MSCVCYVQILYFWVGLVSASSLGCSVIQSIRLAFLTRYMIESVGTDSDSDNDNVELLTSLRVLNFGRLRRDQSHVSFLSFAIR